MSPRSALLACLLYLGITSCACYTGPSQFSQLLEFAGVYNEGANGESKGKASQVADVTASQQSLHTAHEGGTISRSFQSTPLLQEASQPSPNLLGFPNIKSFLSNFAKSVEWTSSRKKRDAEASLLGHGHVLPPPHDVPPHSELPVFPPLDQPLHIDHSGRISQLSLPTPTPKGGHHVTISTPTHHISHGILDHGSHHAVHKEHHQVHGHHIHESEHHEHHEHHAHHVTPTVSPITISHGLPPVPIHVEPKGHLGHYTPTPHHSGYPKPAHGGSLEEIFGVASKYAPAPLPPTPIPYHPTPAPYHPPVEPQYAAPEPKYAAPSYHTTPKPYDPQPHHPHPHEGHLPGGYVAPKESMIGHPFSLEHIFALPMPKFYQEKYPHMAHLMNHIHEHEHKVEEYVEPKPDYIPPKVYDHPVSGYPKPAHGASLEEIFGVHTRYHPAIVKPDYHPPDPYEMKKLLPPSLNYIEPEPHPKPEYKAPKPDYHPPKPEYHAPKPEYHPPKPEYHPPKPEFHLPKPEYHAPKPDYHPPKPDYHPPKPDYHPPKPEYHPPKPDYHAPKPEYHPPKPEFHLPKPEYHAPEPEYHPPKPEYHAPKPEYHAPKPEYHPPKPEYHGKHGYAPPYNGGSLEEIFGLGHHAHSEVYVTPRPSYQVPDYHPTTYKPKMPEYLNKDIKSLPDPGYVLHYLPYEDYEPHHSESLAHPPPVVHHTGAAHILVPGTHPLPAHPHVKSLDPFHGARVKRSPTDSGYH